LARGRQARGAADSAAVGTGDRLGSARKEPDQDVDSVRDVAEAIAVHVPVSGDDLHVADGPDTGEAGLAAFGKRVVAKLDADQRVVRAR